MKKNAKKAETVKSETVQAVQTTVQPVKLTLWDKLKNVPISMFALPAKPLHTLVEVILAEEKQVICKPIATNGASALVAMLDQKLNVLVDVHGGEQRVDQFEVAMEQGLLRIQQK